MGIAGAGAAASALTIGAFFVIFVCALLLYGSLIAYAGARSKSAFGLLIGQCLLMVGLFLTWVSKAEKSGMVDERPIPNLTQWRVGFQMEFIGLLLVAICFVLYVKQHNKEIKKNATNEVSK